MELRFSLPLSVNSLYLTVVGLKEFPRARLARNIQRDP
jgi:hypothetical protein